MIKQSLRGLRGNPLRVILTGLSVVLGVAFVAGAFILGDTINKSFDEVFTTANQGVDVRVQSEAEELQDLPTPVDAALLPTVAAVPGVAEAEGVILKLGVVMLDRDGEALGGNGPPQFGSNWSNSESNSFVIRDGEPPVADDEFVIDAGSADDAGYEVGDRVPIVLDGPREFTISGIARFGEEDNLAGATFALFAPDAAPRLLGFVGRYSSIFARAEDGVVQRELARDVQAVLPGGVEAITGDQATQDDAGAITQFVDIFRNILIGFGLVALFVASFIIFNTFSITVAQRTRQLGLLRAMGASGRQVRRIVMVESLVIGVIASIIGLFAGLLVAIGLRALLSAFNIDLPSTSLQFLPRTIWVSLLLGIVITFVASLIPAFRASRVSPLEAMRESTTASERVGGRARIIAVTLTALGVLLVGIALFGSLGTGETFQLLGVGAMLLFIGAALMIQLIARPLARFLGGPVSRLAKVPGRLARENAMRSPKRTAATAAALMIGVALVSGASIFTDSVKASLNDTLDDQFRADFIVTDPNFYGFSPALADQLEAEPAIGAVARWKYGLFKDGADQNDVIGADPAVLEQVYDPNLVAGQVADLAGGGVMIQESIADDRDLEVGQTITAIFAQTGRQELPIVAIYDESTFGDYIVSLETFDANFSLTDDFIVLARSADATDLTAATAAFERVAGGFPQLDAQSQQEFKDAQAAQIDLALGLIFALLGLAIIIAIFGIVNTLALSIFERTREIGLLRAVGLSRWQARWMIAWESVLVALIGAVVGIVLGVALGIAIVQALGEDVQTLSVPIPLLVIFFVLAAVAGVLAAIGPAQRAAKMDVLKAIQSE